jgi:2-amino-4-hydroxy-6-hydroxymethyldihydropteridine diphosphokinase
MPEALLGFGGNVGDVRTTLDRAVDAFCDTPAVQLSARSSQYSTPPWGVEDQPPFVNLCIGVETSLRPLALLARAHEIERAFGRDRPREQRWGPRTLDLDVLTYGSLSMQEPNLTLPHPRMLERAFVLVPLLEIRPDAVIAGVRAADALARLDTSGIERLA